MLRKYFVLSLLVPVFALHVHAQSASNPPAESAVLVSFFPLATNTLPEVGTNQGLVVGEGTFRDNSLSLDGETAYVSFDGSLNITNSFSLCLWIKIDAEPDVMRIAGRFQGQTDRDFCLFLTASNQLWCFISDDGSSDPAHALLKTTITPAVPTDDWAHIAVTWDASQAAAGMRLYANGTNLPCTDVQTAPITSLHAGTAKLTLGTYDLPEEAEDAPPVNPFKGSMCRFLVFRGALSDAEVQAIYELGRSDSTSGGSPITVPQYLPGATVSGDAGVTTNLPAGTNEIQQTGGGTNEAPRTPAVAAAARVIYVWQNGGNDTFTGRAPVVVAADGPKKTIQSGLAAATGEDTLIIKEGSYGEDINIAGRAVSVRIEGKVDISGPRRQEQALPVIEPLPPVVTNATQSGIATNSFNGTENQ